MTDYYVCTKQAIDYLSNKKIQYSSYKCTTSGCTVDSSAILVELTNEEAILLTLLGHVIMANAIVKQDCVTGEEFVHITGYKDVWCWCFDNNTVAFP